MKKLYLALMASLFMMAGCTQMNGHIGPIFGSWALTEITEDGSSVEAPGPTIFSFQNEIVRVVLLDKNDNSYIQHEKFGNFTLSDDVLALKFQTKPTILPVNQETTMYMTPNWLKLPTDVSPLIFDITKFDSNNMVLVFHTDPDADANGISHTLTYSFKKTW